MKLGNFIGENLEPILAEWEQFANTIDNDAYQSGQRNTDDDRGKYQ